MRRLTLAGLRAHWRRLLLAALATLLGTAFVAGTLVLGDSLRTNTERTISGNANRADVVVAAQNLLRKLPADTAARIGELPGVRQVQGLIQGDVTVLGRNGRPIRDQPVGFSVTMRTSVTAGRVPAVDDEAVLAEQTARALGYRIGDLIVLLDKARGQRHELRVTGLVDVAGQGVLALRGGVGVTEPVARAMTGEHAYSEVYVRGAPTESLRAKVAGVVGGGPYAVYTGPQFAERQAAASGVDPVVLRSGLVMFALVALFVAMFVIHNTFNILISQRTRELALARCVGASARQVFASVVAESALVGTFAAALGLGLGIGAGYLALAVMGASGAGLGTEMFTLTPLTVALSMLAGVAATMAAALLPARAATRVAPIAALGVQPESRTHRLPRSRLVWALVLCAAGVLGAVAGLATNARIYPLVLVAGGGLLFFVGVIVAGPALVRVLAGAVGLPFRRFLGVPGKLAVANALRNPSRAATTVLALIIGITLTTGVSVITRSLESSVGAGVGAAIPADYLVTPPGTDADVTLPRSISVDLRGRSEVTELTQVREAPVTVRGETAMMSTMEGAIRPAVVRGSLAGFGRDQVALRPERAAELGVDVGDTLAMTVGDRLVRATVVALVTGNVVPRTLASPSWFDELFPHRGDTSLLVRFTPGLPASASRAIMDKATDPVPTAKIIATADAKDRLESSLNQVTTVVTGLLAFAVLISLIGIANTMTLSILERSRESAMLRALGLARRQLRLMLIIEAMIFGIVGGLVGVALGTGFGLMAARVINDNIVLSLPYGRIALILVGAALAGILAALIPGRRIAKDSVMASLARN
ncbi:MULTISPECIES: ABC transporter permease [unclassified Crossiella]|uniref:ABC transporter permease n=1 Tax=unclassified Crossiella TaxID=2620835 RepID=UPI0020001253|nr:MULTISPECIES: ABC transporter permease [unclassified Crossiella]MCK2244318.1 FtsX-like permease family protein [Crossiella sp. S99.2]MCK2257854.1 FtsX-like permease family protein [Crossiella sp. S99.1]